MKEHFNIPASWILEVRFFKIRLAAVKSRKSRVPMLKAKIWLNFPHLYIFASFQSLKQAEIKDCISSSSITGIDLCTWVPIKQFWVDHPVSLFFIFFTDEGSINVYLISSLFSVIQLVHFHSPFFSFEIGINSYGWFLIIFLLLHSTI